MTTSKLLRFCALIATYFTFIVIILGAYTRLVDAGLGCPDWPGCYGHIIVPNTAASVRQIDAIYPQTPLIASKAWAEMIHRYAVGCLSLLVLCVSFLGLRLAIKQARYRLLLPITLLLLLFVYQATLGMLTVTWKLLPVIVSQHLLGGFSIVSLFWLIFLMSKPRQTANTSPIGKLRLLAALGLILLIMQIALGAWTSTNYASISCTGFPFCMSQQTMHWQFSQAFNLASPIGINYDHGQLTLAARQTIQMVHRLGAVVVGVYLFSLAILTCIQLRRQYRIAKISFLIIALVLLQVCFGILNILFKLPIAIALCHTTGAALLLLATISLNYYLYLHAKQKQ